MNIFKKLWKAIKACCSGVIATAGGDNPKFGVKIRTDTIERDWLAAERYAEEIERRLECAIKALSVIEALTQNNPILTSETTERIHELASTAWREIR